MPFVEVSWFEGRSKEQKAELARRITDAVSEVGPCNREDVEVLFRDVRRGDWWQDAKEVGAPPA
jgi:4-oxalocrotonate tautomerase